MQKYDVAIIGSGVAGSTVAYALKNKKTALIEDGLWGGTCPNVGCDPKKVLYTGLEIMENNNRMIGKGFAPLNAIKWPELMAFKRTFTEPYPAKFKQDAQAHGLIAVEGSAKFINDRQIQVNGETIESDVYVIATGQRSSLLDIEGKEHLKTSTDFLEMPKLPETMVFIGASYIAFELGAIANATGSEVTIIDHGARPLRAFDADLVDDLVRQMEAKGVKFAFNVDIRKITREGGKLVLDAGDYLLKTDDIVCATGRIPNVETLNLENAGIKYEKQGIVVNGSLKTSNPRVFACGDVIAKPQAKLTPVASFEGKYLAAKIMDDALGHIQYPAVATIVYGSPKLAQVGVTVTEALKEPGRYSVKDEDLTEWFSYRRLNEAIARVKLVFEDGRLAGACVLNSRADDLINYLTLMIDKRITHAELDRIILGWPTIASDLVYLA